MMQDSMLAFYRAVEALFNKIEEKSIAKFNIVATDHKAVLIPDYDLIVYMFDNGRLKIEQRSGVYAYSLDIDRRYSSSDREEKANRKLLPELEDLHELREVVIKYLENLAKR